MSTDMTKIDIKIVTRIKYLMEAEKISQYALAKKLAICNWLNGKKEPSIESLWKLSDFFDVSIDYLVGKSDI